MPLTSSVRVHRPKSLSGCVKHWETATVFVHWSRVSPRPMDVGGVRLPSPSTRQCFAVTTTRGWTSVPLQPSGPISMMAVGHTQVVARLPPTMGNAACDTGTLPASLSQPSENKAEAATPRRHSPAACRRPISSRSFVLGVAPRGRCKADARRRVYRMARRWPYNWTEMMSSAKVARALRLRRCQ
jgi:hypothetical protein